MICQSLTEKQSTVFLQEGNIKNLMQIVEITFFLKYQKEKEEVTMTFLYLIE